MRKKIEGKMINLSIKCHQNQKVQMDNWILEKINKVKVIFCFWK